MAEKSDHERLKVYQVALEFVAVADSIIQALPPRRAYVADQLQRAATSIVLNIAEGAGEFSRRERHASIAWRNDPLPNAPHYWTFVGC